LFEDILEVVFVKIGNLRGRILSSVCMRLLCREESILGQRVWSIDDVDDKIEAGLLM